MLGLGVWVRVAGLRCRSLCHHIPQLGGREAIDCDAAGRGGGLEDDFGSGRDVHGGDAQNGADTLDFDDDLVRRHARSYGFALATARRPRPDIRVTRGHFAPLVVSAPFRASRVVWRAHDGVIRRSVQNRTVGVAERFRFPRINRQAHERALGAIAESGPDRTLRRRPLTTIRHCEEPLRRSNPGATACAAPPAQTVMLWPLDCFPPRELAVAMTDRKLAHLFLGVA